MHCVDRFVLPLFLVVNLSANDFAITEKSFGCLLDLPKVRNTRIRIPIPKNSGKGSKYLRTSCPVKKPTGTILQLIPTEAMVKHDRATFPNTSGWEFFVLKGSAAGTTIQDRGDKVLNALFEEAMSELPLTSCEIRFRMRKEAWLCSNFSH